jgi:hypothetical protein
LNDWRDALGAWIRQRRARLALPSRAAAAVKAPGLRNRPA